MADASRLTLSHLELDLVRVPMERPIVAAIGTFRTWPLILVNLHTDQGIVGTSYIQPYQERAAGYLMHILYDLAKAQQGAPLAPARDFDHLRQSLHVVGRHGLTLIAVSGLDMAMWDALAKAVGKPLAEYLGGTAGAVPAYNTTGLWLGSGPDRLIDEASELEADGDFRAMKLRLGRPSLTQDLAAVAAVREALGDEVTIMVDFNQGMTFGDAKRRLHGLDDEDLYWFEEPVAYDNLEGCARLRRELITPLQIGENFYGPRDAYDAVQTGACSYIMPDPMRIGGVTGWLRAAAIAEAAGIEMSSHLYPEICSHLLRVTPTAHWLEWSNWVNPILREPLVVADGQAQVPDRPGCGLEWDTDAVARYRIEA